MLSFACFLHPLAFVSVYGQCADTSSFFFPKRYTYIFYVEKYSVYHLCMHFCLCMSVDNLCVAWMCWLTCVHTCKWCWKFSCNKNSPKFRTRAWGSIILEAQDLEDYERACCIWGYHGYKVPGSCQAFVYGSLLHHLVCKVNRLRWQTSWQQSFWIWNTTLGLELALNWHCEWGLVNQVKSRAFKTLYLCAHCLCCFCTVNLHCRKF